MLDRPCVCQHYEDNKNECSKYGTKYHSNWISKNAISKVIAKIEREKIN